MQEGRSPPWEHGTVKLHKRSNKSNNVDFPLHKGLPLLGGSDP